VLVAWQDRRDETGDLVYSQRLTSTGGVAPGWSGDGTVPVLVSLVRARVDDGVARLEWFLGAGIPVRIYRATASGAWTVLASVTSDGTGYVTYDDAAIEPGRRYGYRIGVLDGTHESVGGETWLDVAARHEFELVGANPNPVSSSELHVTFRLPDARSARLELHDLLGRRLSALDVGPFGAGNHTAVLKAPHELAPGIYLLRLIRAGQTLTARATVLR
jgi:hypothetical protein